MIGYVGNELEIDFSKIIVESCKGLPASWYVGGQKIYSIPELDTSDFKEFDMGLFLDLTSRATQLIEKRINTRFEILPLDRWYLVHHNGREGGFYSKSSYGYCDIPQYAFTARPVGEIFSSKTDFTLEVARGYLHDLFHHNTFSSYGVKLQEGGGPKVPPSLFRFQHGFNFRNANGISYSAPPSKVAEGFINLGILMDGIGTIVGGEALASVIGEEKRHYSHELLEDVRCVSPIENGRRFFNLVSKPTKDFFDRWRTLDIYQLIDYMFNGDVLAASEYFSSRTNVSWRDAFRQDNFRPEFFIP